MLLGKPTKQDLMMFDWLWMEGWKKKEFGDGSQVSSLGGCYGRRAGLEQEMMKSALKRLNWSCLMDI